MLRKKTQKRKPNPADSLLKTSKKNDIELTEQELGRASGGLVTGLDVHTKTSSGTGGAGGFSGFLSTVGHVLTGK
jgi:hypothetical protein